MTGQLLLGFCLSVFVGSLGYWRRSLTAGGFAGAIVIGTMVFGLGGWVWGLVLVTFFVSSSWFSRYRKAEKKSLAEKFEKGSRRDLVQVLANGSLAAVLAIASASYPEPLLLAAFLGVMGTVNADTWATEIGVLSPVPPRLITTGEQVPPGSSGGVSWLGTWASVAGALLIGAVATAFTQTQSVASSGTWSMRAVSFPLLAVTGGIAGALLDSLLGATVQAVYVCDHCQVETESPIHRCSQPSRPLRGWSWLNNDVVNLVSSLVGGLVSAALAWALWS